MTQHPPVSSLSQQEDNPDAWERFEGAVAKVIKAGPQHRPTKPSASRSPLFCVEHPTVPPLYSA